MDPDRWARAKELFHEALEREPERRETFLLEACSDETLREAVRSMLARQRGADGFLESPALHVEAMAIAADLRRAGSTGVESASPPLPADSDRSITPARSPFRSAARRIARRGTSSGRCRRGPGGAGARRAVPRGTSAQVDARARAAEARSGPCTRRERAPSASPAGAGAGPVEAFGGLAGTSASNEVDCRCHCARRHRRGGRPAGARPATTCGRSAPPAGQRRPGDRCAGRRGLPDLVTGWPGTGLPVGPGWQLGHLGHATGERRGRQPHGGLQRR